MGRLVGLLVVALIAVVAYTYFFKASSPRGASTPAATIDSVGAQNDILAIAQAERSYQAQHGNYATLEDLNSSGELSVPKTGRRGYTYEVETDTDTFRVMARCAGADTACTSYAVTQTMQVEPLP
jgi:hypothetical protein